MGDSRKEGRPITLSLEADPDPPRSRRSALLTGLSLALAGAMLYAPLPAPLRWVTIGLMLMMAVMPELARRVRARRVGAGVGRRQSLVVDSKGVWRSKENGEAVCISRWDEAFGVTVLANPSKTRAVFAFSSSERTRIVAVRIDGAQAADSARRCLEHAVLVSDADLDDALGGGAIGGGLSGKSAAVLFAEVERRARLAIGRIYLFDAAGARVTLEGDKLRARDKVIDLGDPLEWRSFMFHEGGQGPAPAVILYQATWARQGPTELVLVCPLPAEASSWGVRATDAPPARELRVAVDRLFMIPLRNALEGAPRISRAGAPPRKSGSHTIRT